MVPKSYVSAWVDSHDIPWMVKWRLWIGAGKTERRFECVLHDITFHHLVPETSTLKWLFQLDDSKSLNEKVVFH